LGKNQNIDLLSNFLHLKDYLRGDLEEKLVQRQKREKFFVPKRELKPKTLFLVQGQTVYRNYLQQTYL